MCHLGRERVPLIDRAPWLYDKACRYLRDGRSRPLSAEVATIVAEASGHFDMLLDMVESPLVADVVLGEAGVFDDFVAERDALLPDDEALLAAQWSVVRRSVFEVERSGRDHVALRDLRTGDHITVTNTHSERETRSGELLLGRPLPVDDTWRAYSGFVPVPDSMRDELLAALDDPDPFVVADLIGRCFAPPTLQNTDGEALVFHELRYRIDDPDTARAVLVAGGLHDGGAGSFTLERDTANQTDAVILAFELTGPEMRVTANSDGRADEARTLVAALLPDAVLEDDDVRELEELLADVDDGSLPRRPRAHPTTRPWPLCSSSSCASASSSGSTSRCRCSVVSPPRGGGRSDRSRRARPAAPPVRGSIGHAGDVRRRSATSAPRPDLNHTGDPERRASMTVTPSRHARRHGLFT